MGAAQGDARRQPVVPGDHHADRRRPGRGRGAAAGVLRGLPEHGPVRRRRPPTGGWQDVLAADTKNPAQPIIYLARSGRMLVDRQARTIQMVLEDGTRHTTKLDDPTAYEVAQIPADGRVARPGKRLPAQRSGPRRSRAVDRRAAPARQGAGSAQGSPPTTRSWRSTRSSPSRSRASSSP